MNRKIQLFVIETWFNFVNVFIVTSDQLNAEKKSDFWTDVYHFIIIFTNIKTFQCKTDF